MKKAVNNQKIIKDIKTKLATGEVSYDTAKLLAQPIIDDMNKDIAEISKKHNKRPYKLNFTGLMR